MKEVKTRISKSKMKLLTQLMMKTLTVIGMKMKTTMMTMKMMRALTG